MTLHDWHYRLGYWCEVLNIRDTPRLEIVDQSVIPGCDAMADFDDSRATRWVVKIRRGCHERPDELLVHELLHVRTGCTDACHEAWICDVARAITRGCV